MSIHIASINGLNLLPDEYHRAMVRDGIIDQMAAHLMAGTTSGLDLTSDFDVIDYLRSTPERYPAKVITSHMDAAVQLAQETITAAIMGLRP